MYKVTAELYNQPLKWKVLILTWPGGRLPKGNGARLSFICFTRIASAHSHTLLDVAGSCFCSLIEGYNHSKTNLNFLTLDNGGNLYVQWLAEKLVVLLSEIRK